MRDEVKTGDWIIWLGVVIALLVGFGSGALASAQNLQPEEIILTSHYDLDSASFIYCRTEGVSFRPDDPNRVGLVPISAAASTTVTGTNAFANVAVGDVLFINVAGLTVQRAVEARASASSITVSGAALTFTSRPWAWRKLVCGTADGSGAFPVDGWHSITFHVILAQEVSTSTDYQVECRNRGPATAWSIVNGPTNDTGLFNDIFATNLGFAECRVGAKVNTDDGDDLTTNAERLTILVSGRR